MATETPRLNVLNLTDSQLKAMMVLVGYAVDHSPALADDDAAMAAFWAVSDALDRYYEREGITD